MFFNSSKNVVFFQIIWKNNLTSSTFKINISLEINTIQNECIESIQVHFFLHGNTFLIMAPDFNSIFVGESHNKCSASLYYSPNHPYFLSPKHFVLWALFPKQLNKETTWLPNKSCNLLAVFQTLSGWCLLFLCSLCEGKSEFEWSQPLVRDEGVMPSVRQATNSVPLGGRGR